MTKKFLKDLLARGYLPEILPPNFTSASFGEFASKHPSRFDQFIKKPARLKGIDYSASKSGYRRRPFVIPHPISQFFVAKFIADRWTHLEKYFKISNYSVSRPTQGPPPGRSVEITPFHELHRIMHQRLGQYGYVAKSDIQRFYSSIYTHSIPWAVHGKAAAKKDGDPNSTAVPFNKLDQCIRRGQDGQTIGIPIGPDTSRIIGEIIGCAIDAHLAKLAPGKFLNCLRHVDDIYFGTDSREDAEACIAALRAALREFGLEINETKTEIYQSSMLRDDTWPRTLLRRLGDYKKSNDDIFALFEESFYIAEKTKSEAPVRYLLRRADKQGIFEDDHWGVTENFLVKCIYDYPHSIDYVARILVWRDILFQDVDKDKWTRVINNRLIHNIEMGHDHQICWLLWIAISLTYPLSDAVAVKLVAYPNPIVALMGAHAYSRKLIGIGVDVSAWENRIDTTHLNDEWWMFAYECSFNKWFKKSLKLTSLQDTIFHSMRRAKVSFYSSALPSEIDDYFDEDEGAIPKLGFGYEDEDGEDVDDEIGDVPM